MNLITMGYPSTQIDVPIILLAKRKGHDMYLYPNNLKGKPMLWFWRMKDVVVICIILLISLFLLIQFGAIVPLVITVLYAILTMRIDDISIMDFIFHTINYLFLEPQTYYWKKEYSTRKGEQQHGRKQTI